MSGLKQTVALVHVKNVKRNFVGMDLTKVKKNSCYNSQLVTTKQDYFYIAFSYYPNKDS